MANITHIDIDSKQQEVSSDDTVGISPIADNQTNKKFKDKMDSNFASILKSIGFMSVVIDRIDRRQEESIDLLKEGIKAGKILDERVIELQDSLEDMETKRRRERAEEEKRRKEEELEAKNKNTFLANAPDKEKAGFGFSTLQWVGIAAAATFLVTIGKYEKEISGLLGLLRSSSGIITTLSGLTSAGTVTKTTTAAQGAGKFFAAYGAGLERVAVTSTGAITTGSKIVANVIWCLKGLQKVAWGIVIVGELINVLQAFIMGDPNNSAQKVFVKAIAKIAGGYYGGLFMGSFAAAVGTFIAGPWGFALGGIAGAIAGGYYGTQLGEAFGEALWELFGSKGTSSSKLTALFDKVMKDLQGKLDQALNSIGSTVDSTVKDIQIGLGLGPSKPNITSERNYPGGPNHPARGTMSGVKNPKELDSKNFDEKGNYIVKKDDPRSWRNNNPGNLMGDKNTAERYGAKGIDREKFGALIFDTPEQGFAAQAKLLKWRISQGYNTLSKLMHKYAPPHENNTEAYITFLEKTLGISRHTILNDKDDDFIYQLQMAIMEYEGGSNKEGLTSKDFFSKNYQKRQKTKTPGTVTDTLGLRIKEGAENSGENNPALNVLGMQLQKEGLLNRVTALNDEHHEGKNSKHEEGLAMDFSLNDPKDAVKAIQRIQEIGNEAGIDIYILPELEPKKYKNSKSKWTGPHIHVAFKSKADADKFYQFYTRRKSTPTPVASIPQSGKEMAKTGPADKAKTIIINNNQPQQQQTSFVPSARNSGGISGDVPMAYNLSKRGILYGVA